MFLIFWSLTFNWALYPEFIVIVVKELRSISSLLCSLCRTAFKTRDQFCWNLDIRNSKRGKLSVIPSLWDQAVIQRDTVVALTHWAVASPRPIPSRSVPRGHIVLILHKNKPIATITPKTLKSTSILGVDVRWDCEGRLLNWVGAKVKRVHEMPHPEQVIS